MNILKFKGNLEIFQTYRIVDTIPLWENDNLIRDYSKLSNYKFDRYELCRLCSYGIKETPIFSNLSFELSDGEMLSAEKYGGIGIGKNLGGARCGNLGDFQIKGVGKNILAYKNAPSKHSNGSLSLLDATIESIYSQILDGLLPHGDLPSIL